MMMRGKCGTLGYRIYIEREDERHNDDDDDNDDEYDNTTTLMKLLYHLMEGKRVCEKV